MFEQCISFSYPINKIEWEGNFSEEMNKNNNSDISETITLFFPNKKRYIQFKLIVNGNLATSNKYPTMVNSSQNLINYDIVLCFLHF